jgi:hypothetical protein
MAKQPSKRKKKKKKKNPAQTNTGRKRRMSGSQIAFTVFAILIVASFLASLILQGR